MSAAPCFVVHCTKLVYRIRVWVIARVTHKELWLPSSLVFSLGQCSVVCWLQGGCCWRILAASVQPLFQCDDKLQRNPSHSWKLGGPSLQRRAPGPSTQTTPMYSFFLFTPFPPIPSLFPSLSAFFPLPSHTASVFFFFLYFMLTRPRSQKSLVVHLKSVFTAGQHLIYGIDNREEMYVCALYISNHMFCVSILTLKDMWSAEAQMTQMIEWLDEWW